MASREDNVFVGPNACLTNDKVPRAFNAGWDITPSQVKRAQLDRSIGRLRQAQMKIVCVLPTFARGGERLVVRPEARRAAAQDDQERSAAEALIESGMASWR